MSFQSHTMNFLAADTQVVGSVHLPPILLGIGIFLPMLLKNPFDIPEKVKLLAPITFAIFCWIAYYLVLALGGLWYYANWVTVAASSVAGVLFLFILIEAIRKGSVGKPIHLVIYVVGMFLISVSASNIVGQEGLTIITFKHDEDIESISFTDIANNEVTKVIFKKHKDINGEKTMSWILPTEMKMSEIYEFKVNSSTISSDSLLYEYSAFPAKRIVVSPQ
jgi:hypothetical protein